MFSFNTNLKSVVLAVCKSKGLLNLCGSVIPTRARPPQPQQPEPAPPPPSQQPAQQTQAQTQQQLQNGNTIKSIMCFLMNLSCDLM